jgi:hypothetical protein
MVVFVADAVGISPVLLCRGAEDGEVGIAEDGPVAVSVPRVVAGGETYEPDDFRARGPVGPYKRKGPRC